MLSDRDRDRDRDRETLHEIQCQLLVEDPSFARSFEAKARRSPSRMPGVTRRIVTVLLVASCSMLAVTVLIGRSLMSALELAAVAALAFEARRRHDLADHQRRRG